MRVSRDSLLTIVRARLALARPPVLLSPDVGPRTLPASARVRLLKCHSLIKGLRGWVCGQDSCLAVPRSAFRVPHAIMSSWSGAAAKPFDCSQGKLRIWSLSFRSTRPTFSTMCVPRRSRRRLPRRSSNGTKTGRRARSAFRVLRSRRLISRLDLPVQKESTMWAPRRSRRHRRATSRALARVTGPSIRW